MRATVLIVLPVLLPIAIPAQDPAPEVQRVATGFGFVEGPAWNRRGGYLLFSDIRNNRIHKLDGDHKVTTFLEPSDRANGLTFDESGNLYACLGGARQVVRIAPDGKRTVLAAEFEGKRLNSPNDLALDWHGGVYFTDPRYGKADDLEQDVMGVYYIPPKGKTIRVISKLERPNGVVISRDGSGLYVAEPNKREIHFYPILSPGRLGRGKMIFRSDQAVDGGGPDGMVIDADGKLYATYANLLVLSAGGELLRRIPIPEKPANCTFWGEDLIITARTSVYRIPMGVRGAVVQPGASRFSYSLGFLPEPKFDAVDIDTEVGVGYGLAVAEINGDGAPDIVLVDRDVVVWYQNPGENSGAAAGWKKHVIARKLTTRDHVCVAARDIDGDGMAEIAVGAGWNPGDTNNSGSVHYLVAPADRTQPWKPIPLPHEPTVHRMRWIQDAKGFGLLVAPLHGRGNRAGHGAGVKLLLYRPPADPSDNWGTEVVDDSLHVTHNVDPVQWDSDPDEELLVASREGLFLFDRGESGFTRTQLAGPQEGDSFPGAGEVRAGQHSGRFLATVEPFHGHQLVAYRPILPGTPRRFWQRQVITSDMKQGHAVACGDVLGLGSDQVVVGWRNKNAAGKVGVRLHIPNPPGWIQRTIDDNGMACEDVRLADLDGDGKLDIVAAGRATHNLRVYFNRTAR